MSVASYPIVVVQDRYGGCYSGGSWIAIREADRLENGAYRIIRCLESGPSDDDVEARMFWSDPPDWVAVGATPDEAVRALEEKDGQASDEARLAALDREIAEGSADLDAGRIHSAADVRAFLLERSRRVPSAAE